MPVSARLLFTLMLRRLSAGGFGCWPRGAKSPVRAYGRLPGLSGRLGAPGGLLGALLLAASAWSGGVQASHIAGADLYYRCLGNDEYEIVFTMYYDCINANSGVTIDDTTLIFIFEASTGDTVRTLTLRNPLIRPIQPNNLNACIGGSQLNICLEEGVYRQRVTLPDIPGGYHLGWTRCCRNNIIDNINTPGDVGLTLFCTIPDDSLAACNSMPVFKQRPPIFLCTGQTLSYDHSAVDRDGDSLVYELVQPFTGLSSTGQGVQNGRNGNLQPITYLWRPTSPNDPAPPANLMGPPPYQRVLYVPGFSQQQPFGTSNGSNIVIDSTTGLLSITPTRPGLYVVGLAVHEYRNGQRISTNVRDVQFAVTACSAFGDPPEVSKDLSQLAHTGDTILAEPDVNFCYPVTARDSNPGDQLTTQVYSNTPGLASSFSGANPRSGQLCWTPPCSQAGKTFQIIVEARDVADCPNYNSAFDTTYVKIPTSAKVDPTLSVAPVPNAQVQQQGDTSLVQQQGETACFRVEMRVAAADARLSYSVVQQNTQGQPVAQRLVTRTDTFIELELCFTPSCDNVAQPAELEILTTANQGCGPQPTTARKVWVGVLPQSNAPPQLQVTDTSGAPTPDTLRVNLGDTLLLDARLTDQLPNTSLTLSTILSPTGGAPNTAPGVSIRPLLNTDTLWTGRLSWTPACEQAGHVYHLLAIGRDELACAQQGRDTAEFYLEVIAPPNPLPQLVLDTAGLDRSGDTLLVGLDSLLCFRAELVDQSPASRLGMRAWFQAPASPQQTPLPETTLLADSLGLRKEFCWRGNCSGVNGGWLLVQGLDSSACALQHSLLDTLPVRVREPANPAPQLSWAVLDTFVQQEGDTLAGPVDSTICLEVRVEDTAPFSPLNFSAELLRLGVEPVPPNLLKQSEQFVSTGLAVYRLCIPLSCLEVSQPLQLLLRVQDSSECRVQHSVADTLLLAAAQPPNPEPTLTRTLTDSLADPAAAVQQAYANSPYCYRLRLADTPPYSRLSLQDAQLLLANGAPLQPPDIQQLVQTDSLLEVELCLTPPCERLGDTLLVVVQFADSSQCNRAWAPADTLRLLPIERPVQPIQLSWEAPGRPVRGDTLLYAAKHWGCWRATVTDSLNGGTLALTATPLWEPRAGQWRASLLGAQSESDNLNLEACWRPACADLTSPVGVALYGESRVACALTLPTVRDTLWLQAVDPTPQPPTVTFLDPSPGPLPAGEAFRARLEVADPDTAPQLRVYGAGAGFEPGFGQGILPTLDTAEVLSPNRSRLWLGHTPNCHLRNTTYSLAVCVEDTAGCQTPETVCDSQTYTLQLCALRMPNVFTPNGDGLHDRLRPIDPSGIATYTLTIHDRTGRLLYTGQNGAWDGRDPQGQPLPEGTYYYLLRFQLFSGQGPLLENSRPGSVTLLR